MGERGLWDQGTYLVEVWMSWQSVPSGSIEDGGFIQLVNQTANDVIRDQRGQMKGDK